MTSPINFGQIQAPQLVQPKSQLDGFAEFLLALQNSRAQRAEARDRIDIARKTLDNTEANDKVTRKKQERELEIADLKLEAEDIADRYAREATTTPGLDEAGVSEIMGRMIQREDRKLAPYLTEAFMRQVQGHQQTLASVAERQAKQSAAKVATETEDARIRNAKTDADIADATLTRAGVELATAKIQKHLAQLDETYGSGRSSIANNMIDNGATIGQAYRVLGIPLPQGVDPNWAKPTSGTNSEAQIKLRNISGQVTLGNALIDGAGDPEITTLGAVIRRGGNVGSLVELLKSKDLKPEERQAIIGYNLLGEGFALYVTGQQASEAQASRLIGILSKQPGETGQVASTRAFVRSAIVNLVQNAAEGSSPADGMQKIVDEAKKRGADGRTLSVLTAFAQQARAAEARGKVGAKPDSVGRIDPVVAARLGVPPARR